MELKIPEKGTSEYSWTEYKLEKESGTYPGCEGSFCRTFMEELERELNKCTGDYHQYISTISSADASKTFFPFTFNICKENPNGFSSPATSICIPS